jgi:hypothetical protein
MRWRGGVASLLLVALLAGEPRAQPAPPAKVEGGSRSAPAPGAGTQIPLVVGSAGDPGPGHTSDNIVVRRGDVLFAGCLIKSMEAREIGFTGDADLVTWPAAVRRLSARYGKLTLVPGHGAIDSTGGAYQHTLDLLSAALPAKR